MPRFTFSCAPLPKETFQTLQGIARAEGATQRQVIVAGVLALLHLSQADPAALRAIWAETRTRCPGRAA